MNAALTDYPLTLLGGPQGELGLLGSMMLGVSMGLTACTVTCLPFMGTWVLGRGRGHDSAMADTWHFIGGRVFAYGLLGLLAGSLGEALSRWLASGVGNLSIGLASCFAGAWLLLPILRNLARRLPGRTAPSSVPAAAQPMHFVSRRAFTVALRIPAGDASGCSALRRGASLPPFLLGASLSLTPCAPLGWLLTVCALSGSAGAGFGHGLAFGMGAAVTPLLLLVPLFGVLGSRLLDGRSWLADWMGGGAGAVLIVLGLKRLLLV